MRLKNYSESNPASSLGLKGFKVVSFDKSVLLVEVMALAPLDQFPTVGFNRGTLHVHWPICRCVPWLREMIRECSKLYRVPTNLNPHTIRSKLQCFWVDDKI